MHVHNVMKVKGTAVATIAPDASLTDATASLRDHGVGALVVSRNGRTIDGIISERDIVRGLAQSEGGVRDRLVSELMTAPVKTCVGTDSIGDLMERMTEHRIRHLPVEEDGKLVGMISIGDVVKCRVTELEEEARHLEGYISGAGYA